MNGYFMIDNKETNSVEISDILIKAIRKLETKTRGEEETYFIPEYYNKAGNDEFGCGKWTITQKGMALLSEHFRNTCKNNLMIAKKEFRLEQFYNDIITRCSEYVTNIFVDMILQNKEDVQAVWV